MKMKRTVLAAAAAVAGTWVMPSAVLADPTPYVIVQCGDSSCDVYECSTYPNMNGTGYDLSGCSYSYSYPRQREVSGD